MTKTLLDDISIASPCSADWNEMAGDDRRRFCVACKLNVHDLSGMTADEATALLTQASAGRVCVRFFRRADGTVLTRDCPVGLRQKLRRAWARTAALWLALWGSAVACVRPTPGPDSAPAPLQGEVDMGLVGVGEPVMGDIAEPAPASQPSQEHPLMGRVMQPSPPTAEQPPKK